MASSWGTSWSASWGNSWGTITTEYVAQLSAPSFGFTAQSLTRFNEYIVGFSAAVVNITGQAVGQFADLILTLSTAISRFTPRIFEVVIQGVYPEFFHPAMTRAYKRWANRFKPFNLPQQ